MRKKIVINSIKNEKTFDEGFNEFLKYCKIRNLREDTIKTYTEVVEFTWYKFFNRNNFIKNIDEDLFSDFILYLKNNTNQQDSSIASNIKKMRTILNYFMKLVHYKFLYGKWSKNEYFDKH